MRETLQEEVTVLSLYDRSHQDVRPVKLKWQGKEYRITKLGMHHMVRQGRTLYHIFSVTDGHNFFRLSLNTENLHWTLEGIHDGLAD